jgi:pSer/pThr/pTyr-binding forkhead associated (FHA) protein
MPAKNTYIIIRDDLPVDPVTIITEGLLIGRLRESEVLLNHPSVSRAQAGIKQVEDDYYLFALRPENPVKLNGRPVEENEALASGDILDVGPFQLKVDSTEEALVLRVSLRIGMEASGVDASSASLTTADLDEPVPAEGKRAAKPRPPPIATNRALDIFWDKRIREAGKMVRPSPLFPKSQRRAGKAQFNWTPTTDLVSRWPVSFFIWAAIGVGLTSVAAAFWYASAYAPAPISSSHATAQLALIPAIAAKPNAGSCTGCHSLTGKIEAKCASCHNTEAFVATVIKPHADAEVGCVDCHAEHRGVDFNAAEAAELSCTGCHNNLNQKSYNGRRVGTPHGGTFGYPVVDGKWNLKTIDDEEWALKRIAVTRLPTETDEQWRSKQFHSMHVQRVRVVPGIAGNAQGELSCSSCHKSSFNPIDRTTPRTTCGACHNGKVDPTTGRVLIAKDQPNCTSCHVQHIRNKRHWGASMLVN